MRLASFFLAISFAAGLMAPAQAVVNLVTNGDFEQIDQPRSRQISVHPNEQYLPGWTNGTASDGAAGYNFYATPGTATLDPYDAANSEIAIQTNDFGYLSVWGADNGGAASNTFTGYSPSGGNFVIGDGNFRVAPISQLITGLIAGQTYNLSFLWAGGQQYSSADATTERWIVSLGNQVQSTTTYANASHDFSGWMNSNMQFTAGASSQLLSFLADGSPNGQPPLVFLDHVSLSAAVPEPASWAMMIIGFGAVGATMRLRRRIALPS